MGLAHPWYSFFADRPAATLMALICNVTITLFVDLDMVRLRLRSTALAMT
jgi:hypothetical protein